MTWLYCDTNGIHFILICNGRNRSAIDRNLTILVSAFYCFGSTAATADSGSGVSSCVRNVSSIGRHIAVIDLNPIHAAVCSTANSGSAVYICNILVVASMSALGIHSSAIDDNGTAATLCTAANTCCHLAAISFDIASVDHNRPQGTISPA